MSDETETTFCSSCKQDVPTANMAMHTIHCQRFLTCCPHCKESINKNMLDEHIEENHIKVRCDACKEILEKMDMESHKETSCKRRTVKCPYCEISLPASDMEEHKHACGSRTEECETCQKRILVKNLAVHVESGCQEPRETTRMKNEPETRNNNTENVYNRSNRNEGLPYRQHLLENSSKRLPGKSETNYRSGAKPGLVNKPFIDQYETNSRFGAKPGLVNKPLKDQYETNSRFGAKPRPLNKRFMDKSKTNSRFGAKPGLTNSGDSSEDDLDVQSSRDTLKPFLNTKNSDSTNIDRKVNISKGKFNVTVPAEPNKARDVLVPKQVVKPRKSQESKGLPDFGIPDPDSDDAEGEERSPHADLSETFLPCEFCDKLFPADTISFHQANCDKGMSPSSRPRTPPGSLPSASFTSSFDHSFPPTFDHPSPPWLDRSFRPWFDRSSRPPFEQSSPPSLEPFSPSLDNPLNPSSVFDTPNGFGSPYSSQLPQASGVSFKSKKKDVGEGYGPCQFCSELIPFDALGTHQFNCSENPVRSNSGPKPDRRRPASPPSPPRTHPSKPTSTVPSPKPMPPKDTNQSLQHTETRKSSKLAPSFNNKAVFSQRSGVAATRAKTRSLPYGDTERATLMPGQSNQYLSNGCQPSSFPKNSGEVIQSADTRSRDLATDARKPKGRSSFQHGNSSGLSNEGRQEGGWSPGRGGGRGGKRGSRGSRSARRVGGNRGRTGQSYGSNVVTIPKSQMNQKKDFNDTQQQGQDALSLQGQGIHDNRNSTSTRGGTTRGWYGGGSQRLGGSEYGGGRRGQGSSRNPRY